MNALQILIAAFWGRPRLALQCAGFACFRVVDIAWGVEQLARLWRACRLQNTLACMTCRRAEAVSGGRVQASLAAVLIGAQAGSWAGCKQGKYWQLPAAAHSCPLWPFGSAGYPACGWKNGVKALRGIIKGCTQVQAPTCGDIPGCGRQGASPRHLLLITGQFPLLSTMSCPGSSSHSSMLLFDLWRRVEVTDMQPHRPMLPGASSS